MTRAEAGFGCHGAYLLGYYEHLSLEGLGKTFTLALAASVKVNTVNGLHTGRQRWAAQLFISPVSPRWGTWTIICLRTRELRMHATACRERIDWEGPQRKGRPRQKKEEGIR